MKAAFGRTSLQMPLSSFLLLHNDQRDQFQRFIALVLQAVALAVTGGADVASVNDAFLTVVAEKALALDDVVELGLMMVVMVADGATGIHYDMGKHTAMAVQSGFVRQILDVNDALSVLDAGIPAVALFRRCDHNVSSYMVLLCCLNRAPFDNASIAKTLRKVQMRTDVFSRQILRLKTSWKWCKIHCNYPMRPGTVCANRIISCISELPLYYTKIK